MIDLDKIFDFHVSAMKLREKRSEIIANNLANVDTPGFKAKDIDFQAAMRRYSNINVTLAGSNDKHIGVQNDPTGLLAVRFRPSFESSLDGNTVDKEVETINFAKNAFDYQTSLTFINGTIKGIRKAIKGE